MALEERDRYSGHMTTGHDWNGIKELNTKVPRLLIICLMLAFLFSLGYWYLLPAWPLGNDYTKGKLAIDQKQEVQQRLVDANTAMTEWVGPLTAASFTEIRANQELMAIVAESGPALFKDNCAVCHGQQAEGNRNYPKLSDASWLWGGAPEQIEQTLLVGINAGIDGTRIAQMPAFGSNGILTSDEIADVVTYLLSLSGGQVGSGSKAAEVLSMNRGNTIFSSNCAACHGADAKGNIALGAPNLTDEYWMYGSDRKSITETLFHGRAGWMPAWSNRLSAAKIKLLSLHVADISTHIANDEANIE